MPESFINPIVESAVRGNRQSLDSDIKLQQVNSRCEKDEKAIFEMYQVGNPYDTKGVAKHNRLIKMVKLLDQDEIDMR